MRSIFNETKLRQPAYAGKPLLYSEADAKEHIGNAIIECAEAISEFPKPWTKSPLPLSKKKALLEIVDAILFLFASCAWLGFTYSDLEEAMEEKLAFNKAREEHRING